MIKRFLKVCEAYYVPFYTFLVMTVVALVYFFEPDLTTMLMWVAGFGAILWSGILENARYWNILAVKDESLAVEIKMARRWNWVSGFGAGLVAGLATATFFGAFGVQL